MTVNWTASLLLDFDTACGFCLQRWHLHKHQWAYSLFFFCVWIHFREWDKMLMVSWPLICVAILISLRIVKVYICPFSVVEWCTNQGRDDNQNVSTSWGIGTDGSIRTSYIFNFHNDLLLFPYYRWAERLRDEVICARHRVSSRNKSWVFLKCGYKPVGIRWPLRSSWGTWQLLANERTLVPPNPGSPAPRTLGN